jgi:hypothetical protein
VYNQLKPMVDDNNNKVRKVRSDEDVDVAAHAEQRLSSPHLAG